jgi:hypothetical protein
MSDWEKWLEKKHRGKGETPVRDRATTTTKRGRKKESK